MQKYILKNGSTTEDLSNFEIRLGVVGYRNYHNYDHIKRELDEFRLTQNIDLIVSGGCTGVDILAERYADSNNIPKLILLPVRSLGNKSFAIRDQEIVNCSTHMLAFPSKKGNGTQLTIGMAHRRSDIILKVIEID